MKLKITPSKKDNYKKQLKVFSEVKLTNEDEIVVTPENATEVLTVALLSEDYEIALQLLKNNSQNFSKINGIFKDNLEHNQTVLTFVIDRILSGGEQTIYLELVEELLKRGANVNLLVTDMGYAESALHKICFKDRIKTLETLLDYNADLNLQDSCGDTPLHKLASRSPYHDMKNCVELLIARAANVNATNKNGYTPLTLCPNKKIIDLLIANGADPKHENNFGENILATHLNGKGTQFKKEEYIEFIIKYNLNMNFQDKHQATLLHRSLGSYNKDGFYFNRIGPHFSINEPFIEALLEMNDESFINQKDKYGYTVYDYLILDKIENLSLPDDNRPLIKIFEESQKVKLNPEIALKLKEEKERLELKRNQIPSAPESGESTLMAIMEDQFSPSAPPQTFFPSTSPTTLFPQASAPPQTFFPSTSPTTLFPQASAPPQTLFSQKSINSILATLNSNEIEKTFRQNDVLSSLLNIAPKQYFPSFVSILKNNFIETNKNPFVALILYSLKLIKESSSSDDTKYKKAKVIIRCLIEYNSAQTAESKSDVLKKFLKDDKLKYRSNPFAREDSHSIKLLKDLYNFHNYSTSVKAHNADQIAEGWVLIGEEKKSERKENPERRKPGK